VPLDPPCPVVRGRRAREVVERFEVARAGFAALLAREPAPLDDLAAPVERLVDERFAVERFAGALRALDERVAPPLADLAPVERVDVERFAADLFAVDFLVAVDFFAAVDFAAPERFAVDLRAGFDLLLVPDEVEAVPSTLHLPDITRWAASATASAIIEPSLVALETTLLAALSAVSAASSPASRIFFRAAGLALIAAAAAARPAASISLLIAAFASLSTVVSLFELDRDEEELERGLEELEREELLRADFAIFYLPPSDKRHFRAVPVP